MYEWIQCFTTKLKLDLEKHSKREERREMERVVLNIHTTKAGEMICVDRMIVYLLFVAIWGSWGLWVCLRLDESFLLFTSTYVCEQWQHKPVKVMTTDSLTRNGLVCTVWSCADTDHEWQQRTVCKSSEAAFVYVLASVKSLNAAANSGDYSNLILDKLQDEKWAEDQAAVACVCRSSLSSPDGGEGHFFPCTCASPGSWSLRVF